MNQVHNVNELKHNRTSESQSAQQRVNEYTNNIEVHFESRIKTCKKQTIS